MVRLERSHKKYMYFKEVIKMRIMRKGDLRSCGPAGIHGTCD